MSMDCAQKKQPDIVRGQLLEAAAQVAVERGLMAITLDAVARRAGVSKGGLLHHFSNRQALIEALFKELLAQLDRRVKTFISKDQNPRGRFSRAYLLAVAAPTDGYVKGKLLGASALAMSVDDSLSKLWREWLEKSLEENSEGENSVIARTVRYAADGIWLDDCTGVSKMSGKERGELIFRLLELTHAL